MAKRVPAKQRYGRLRLSQYFAQRLPNLKGTGLQCQGFTRVFVDIFQKHMDATDPLQVRVLQGLRLQRRMDKILLANMHAYGLAREDSDTRPPWSAFLLHTSGQ